MKKWNFLIAFVVLTIGIVASGAAYMSGLPDFYAPIVNDITKLPNTVPAGTIVYQNSGTTGFYGLAPDGTSWINMGSTTTAAVGNWTAYTPTFAGMGSVTGIKMFYRIVGNGSLEIQGDFNLGTVTGSTATMSLPASKTTITGYDTVQIVGMAFHNVATAYEFSVIAKPNDTVLYFGVTPSATYAPTATQAGSTLWGSSEIIHVNATVQIQ